MVVMHVTYRKVLYTANNQELNENLHDRKHCKLRELVVTSSIRWNKNTLLYFLISYQTFWKIILGFPYK